MSVPSVPEITKVNVPAVALFNITVNGVPAVVGVRTCGAKAHVPGNPGVQLSVTLPVYPLCAVAVPVHVML